MNKVINYSTVFASCLIAGLAQAGVGDGPRAYQVGPVGIQKINVMPINQDSSFNIDGSPAEPAARIKAKLVALQYTSLIDISGKTAGLFVIAPMGEVTGDLLKTSKQGENSGLGDIVVGGVIGLAGAPAMTMQEFATYKPEFGFGLLGKITLPTGEYSADKMFNLGANRWAAQLGGVLSWYFGESLLPGQVTSFELTPTITVYGDNDDPTSGDLLEQKELYTLEANLTHDFNSQFWGSVDALYLIGGATITDGIKAENETEKFLLGATVGAYLPNGYSLQLNYGKTLKVDSDGYNDHLVRLKISKSF